MAATYRTAPVRTAGDPLLAAARLAGSARFDGHVVYEGPDGYAFAGGAAAEFVLRSRTLTRTAGGRTVEEPWRGDPLEPVRAFLDGLDIADWRAYGWCAFELAYAVSGGGTADDGEETVLAHLVVPRTEVRFTADGAVVRSLDPDELRAVAALVAEPAPEPAGSGRLLAPGLAHGAAHYEQAVDAAVGDIRDGRLQKVVLSRYVPVDEEIDFVATYVAGRRANTPARSFLLDLAGLRVTGFSPETVVEVTADGRVASQPLAGTRALTGDAGADRARREDLLSDPKELHEHAISVKVAVDELAGPCKPDTVVIQEYMTVKERGTVQHLASKVAGRLPEGGSPWDAFAAVFPAVTASGVPKHAAYERIRAHEPRRGPYAGTVLTVGADGSMDAALVLRSVFAQDGRTWLRAGAGVVEHSRPGRELEETCEKLASVARTLVARG
ncbi:salicylate synthase [Streptomyces gamaensis]|uniref:Salicylate synthase n=1 Tax=Streptomyces gamaensis TaxID=1763542 RepID=A0ABW0Z2C2_9ACTN